MTLCETAAIEGATPYTLRHSFVSEGVPGGVPLEVVSDLAGHKDVETTASNEAHNAYATLPICANAEIEAAHDRATG